VAPAAFDEGGEHHGQPGNHELEQGQSPPLPPWRGRHVAASCEAWAEAGGVTEDAQDSDLDCWASGDEEDEGWLSTADSEGAVVPVIPYLYCVAALSLPAHDS
jgi:hypothetical protein